MFGLGALIGLIDPISRIAGKIADAKMASIQATTDKEKIAADERIRALEDRRSVLIAESTTPINAIVRACASLGPIAYTTKILLWDKVIGSFAGYTPNVFRTDDITPEQWKLIAAVFAYYFLYDITGRIMRKK